jgi:hypothetical protein
MRPAWSARRMGDAPMHASLGIAGCLAGALLAGCVTVSSSNPGASSPVVLECDEDDVPAAEHYLDLVVAETRSRWKVPAGLEGAQLVWVHLVLDPQGRVLTAAVTSGDPRLAETALRALVERTPSGPPPACLVGIDLAVRLENPAYREAP